MSTEGPDGPMPQWKRDLILRRRAVGRVLPTGSGSVQLTCPSVVDAVRLAEYSVSSDFHRSCESEREPTRVYKNMRLIEQVNTSDGFVEPCVLGIKEIITKIESGSNKEFKMGEEKNGRRKFNSSLICHDGKSNRCNGIIDDDNASDSSEEFTYGPGIVSKLKSKYLSLTLRESQGKIRPSLDSLRRATSLENILNSPEPEKFGEYKSNYLKNIQTANSNSNSGSSNQRCRGLSRNSRESMKRARSVEVLTRYDRGNSVASNRKSLDNRWENEEEDEIDGGDKRNVRSRVNSLSVEEKELPPPDLVKQTLKIFEKSQDSKAPALIKRKDQKKQPDLVSARKPVASPRSVLPKTNDNLQVSKSPLDLSKLNSNDISKKNGSDKNVNNNNVDNFSDDSQYPRIPNSDLPGANSRRKTAFLRENLSSESVISKTSHGENQLKNATTHQNETSDVTNITTSNAKSMTLNSNLKNGLSLDLTDLAVNHTSIQKASPANLSSSSSSSSSTSKCTNDRVIPDLTEVKRSISPVLVRAPPSILSTELNNSGSGSSFAQNMKQVGVIRPIVTNKVVSLNIAKQQLNKTHLTEREIEKNLINKVKCIEQPITKVIVSLKKSPEECFVSNDVSQQPAKESPTKRGQHQFWDQKSNTMVFNFSNRKNVPDYIENDGMILAPRREKPKLGEPGIIILNGETDESSTDFDAEEFMLEPPMPCDIVFEGDNILINGRSNIQTKPKSRKMKIQFNDEATTLFEYPSEASLLDDQENNAKPETEVNAAKACSPGLPSPFRCGSLASYTPSKVSLSTDFQLGITKTAPPAAPRTSRKESEDSAKGEEALEKDEREEGGGEEEEGCLRPAEDAAPVAWNSETAADLLF